MANTSRPAPAPLVLCRHLHQPEPSFELRLASVANVHSWRWQMLGRLSFITQRRLDAAIATLQARDARWRELVAGRQHEDPHDLRRMHHVHVGIYNAPRQLRIVLADLENWSCRGHGVSFSCASNRFGRVPADQHGPLRPTSDSRRNSQQSLVGD